MSLLFLTIEIYFRINVFLMLRSSSNRMSRGTYAPDTLDISKKNNSTFSNLRNTSTLEKYPIHLFLYLIILLYVITYYTSRWRMQKKKNNINIYTHYPCIRMVCRKPAVQYTLEGSNIMISLSNTNFKYYNKICERRIITFTRIRGIISTIYCIISEVIKHLKIL